MARNEVTICSVYFRPVKANRSFRPFDGNKGGYFSTFEMPACKPGEHAMLKVGNHFQRTYISEGNYNDIPVYADGLNGLAHDLVNEWAHSVLGGEFGGPGIFVCAGDEPSKEEIEQAEAKQRAWCEWRCLQAEENWINGRKTGVTKEDREAALWLGRNDYEWVSDAVGSAARTKPCPACFKSIDSRAWKCSFCGSVADFNLAQEYMDRAEKLDAQMKKLGTTPLHPGEVRPSVSQVPPLMAGARK